MSIINGTPATPETMAAANPQSLAYQQAIEQMKPLFKEIQTAKNPAALVQQMCMQNPEFKERYEMARSIAGGNPKEVFYARARQLGIDPDAFVSALCK